MARAVGVKQLYTARASVQENDVHFLLLGKKWHHALRKNGIVYLSIVDRRLEVVPKKRYDFTSCRLVFRYPS